MGNGAETAAAGPCRPEPKQHAAAPAPWGAKMLSVWGGKEAHYSSVRRPPKSGKQCDKASAGSLSQAKSSPKSVGQSLDFR